jgi:hypothetical protein
MPTPIRYSPAPYEAPWYETLLSPVVLAGNLAVAAVAYPGLHTARVSWHPDAGPLIAFLRERTRPVIFYSWHAYELPILCAVYHLPDDVRPLGIGHDGLFSRVFQRATTWLGVPVWVYRRRSAVKPGQQIIDLIQTAEEPPILGLIPDAGGPYGKMKPGILRIARATSAHLVPVAVHAEPSLLQRHPARYVIPLPLGRVRVHFGAALDGSTVSAEEAHAALEALDGQAHGIWSRGAEESVEAPEP